LRRRSRRSRLDLLRLGFFFFTFGESFKSSDYRKFARCAQVASQAPPAKRVGFDDCGCPRGSLAIGLCVAPKRSMVDGLSPKPRSAPLPEPCFAPRLDTNRTRPFELHLEWDRPANRGLTQHAPFRSTHQAKRRPLCLNSQTSSDLTGRTTGYRDIELGSKDAP
jgi:hypothetical protein